MKIINTRLHGVLDYTVAVLLIAMPWILGFAESGCETWIPVIAGATTIVYSLLTRYEYSISPLIPMRTHLWLDALSGVALIATPYLFGYTDRFYLPQVFAGILELLVTGFTKTKTTK
jgi:hypothetical protein